MLKKIRQPLACLSEIEAFSHKLINLIPNNNCRATKVCIKKDDFNKYCNAIKYLQDQHKLQSKMIVDLKKRIKDLENNNNKNNNNNSNNNRENSMQVCTMYLMYLLILFF